MQVANLGDSRCVLGRVQSSKAGPAGMVAVPLTRDHKPDRPDEHQRILAAGGQVRGTQTRVRSTRSQGFMGRLSVMRLNLIMLTWRFVDLWL